MTKDRLLDRDWREPVPYPDPAVEVIDPRFRRYVLSSAALERLWTGARWAEGPVWFGDSRHLVFSDIPNNRMLRWSEHTGEVDVFRAPSNNANGNTRDRQGRLVTCEHGSRRVTRTEHDGTITVLMDRFEGKRLNAPNDVVVHTDGGIWFTDPGYGIIWNYEGNKAPFELPTRVYRIDPQTLAATVVIEEMEKPNGLAFSPDYSVLYVVDTGASHKPGYPHQEAVARRGDAVHRAADRGGVAPGETQDRASALERWLQAWHRGLQESEQRQRRLDDARRESTAARNAEERARGELDQFAKNMPDVSAAEEAEQAARLAHDRLRRLDATLDTTIEFLRRAEERVHRDIAPKLRAGVVGHLSRITGGRYTDCRIDPQSLAVEVRSGTGPWRRAEWLSHGAAEQIYLLLRMALAEHLSAPDETCPLILDDPIATSDATRRQAVLDTLLAVSESTQVILFTHDRDTREWARQRLSEPTGRLRELDRAGIPA